MKAFITKYALTKGIKEADIYQPNDGYAREVGNSYTWYRSDEWYETREEAIAKAEKMRVKKIASLKKKLAKLEKMRFE